MKETKTGHKEAPPFPVPRQANRRPREDSAALLHVCKLDMPGRQIVNKKKNLPESGKVLPQHPNRQTICRISRITAFQALRAADTRGSREAYIPDAAAPPSCRRLRPPSGER